jgi:hypothetical protein
MHPSSCTWAAGTRQTLDAGRNAGRHIAGGTTLVNLMPETAAGALVRMSEPGCQSPRAFWQRPGTASAVPGR